MSSKPQIVKKISKVVPVSSDESEEEVPQDQRQGYSQSLRDKSNQSGSEDMEVDSSSQYVPPRRRRNPSPDQDIDVAGRLRSSSPDIQSLPPGTDIDDASSLGATDKEGDDNDDDDDDDEISHRSRTHSSTRTRPVGSSKQCKEDSRLKQSLSGRAQKFAQEVPKFKAPALKNDKVFDLLLIVPKPAAAAPRVWSPETEYNPPGVGQRLISLRAQSPKIQEVLGKAVTTSIGLFLIKDAYPDVGLRETMLQDALVSAATEVGLEELAERLYAPDERKWRKFLCDYVFNRVIHVRSDVKKRAESVILDSEYPITGRLCDVACYISFITLKLRYVFLLKAPPPPQFDEVVVPPTDVPAEGAEIPPVVTKRVERPYVPSYTKDESLELQGVLMGAFSSSLDEDKYPDSESEPEVPMSMVALAAAAVHFCLSEWATGSLHTAEFKGDKARPEYRKNMELLQKIQKDHPLRYHALMSNLLTQAMESDINGAESDGVPDIY
ncbi:hypothetical protein BT96DRAFT_943679 [Gymnopus androsaceus JB14]|uniref:DUF6532 domain-containing protein n=1 Tax=Gymnopus androsaceus JB14 TaxID=1447944 RepID=A0A6A4H7Q2_9AGAR|nr:hypothetical protein BT96DRAFT_943679 [Gymnopus androsaceus JB14]